MRIEGIMSLRGCINQRVGVDYPAQVQIERLVVVFCSVVEAIYHLSLLGVVEHRLFVADETLLRLTKGRDIPATCPR